MESQSDTHVKNVLIQYYNYPTSKVDLAIEEAKKRKLFPASELEDFSRREEIKKNIFNYKSKNLTASQIKSELLNNKGLPPWVVTAVLHSFESSIPKKHSWQKKDSGCFTTFKMAFYILVVFIVLKYIINFLSKNYGQY